MRYHSVSSRRVKDYVVHPYRLAFAQGGHVSAGLRSGVQDVRTFAIDRITSVSLEKQTFTPKQDIGDEVFANSLGVNTGPAASAWKSSSRRRWRPTSGRACGTRRRDVRENGDGAVRLTMDVCHDWALRSWILSWGPFARVVSPAPLAGAIRADLEAAGTRTTSIMTQTRSPFAVAHRRPSGLSGRAVARPLLHGLAVVRRAWLSVRLRDDAAQPGDAVHDRLRRHPRVAGAEPAHRRGVARPTRARCSRRARDSRSRCRGASSSARSPMPRAAIVALLAGLYAAGEWESGWRGATPCRSARPIRCSGATSAFYVFTLPFLQFVRAAAAGDRHRRRRVRRASTFVSGSLVSTFPATMSLSPSARRHLALLAAAFLLVLAFGAWLRQRRVPDSSNRHPAARATRTSTGACRPLCC